MNCNLTNSAQMWQTSFEKDSRGRAISRMINPDGCTWLNTPLTDQYIKLIRKLMAKKAQISGSRVTAGLMPFSGWLTKITLMFD